MNDLIPKCEHGKIILGCPLSDYVEQNAYIAEAQANGMRFVEMQENEAKKLVRPWAAEVSR